LGQCFAGLEFIEIQSMGGN